MPGPKHPKASEEVRAAFKKRPDLVQEQVTAPPRNLPVRLLLEDEARCGRITDPRRCGAPPGIRPEGNPPIVRAYE
jgi:hypothetical protein